MAKVSSEQLAPQIKKPLATTPPLTEYDPAYLARKAAVGERLFALKNGRQLCYFTEGDKADPAVVCLPALGESKWGYVFPEPLPGVFLIAVDRIGHGKSSPLNPCEQWSDQCAEVLELVDSLGVDKFYITGCSTGGVHTIMMAAAYPDRVAGIAPVSAPTDAFHPSVTKQLRKTFADSFLFGVNQKGCSAACSRWMIRKISAMQYPADKTKDFGMADWWKYFQNKGCGGTPESVAEMNKDLFFATKMMDSHLHGNNTKLNFYHTSQLLYAPYDLDFAKVKCPTFIYHGKLDSEAWIGAAEQNHKLLPGSELLVHNSHGHMSIFMHQARIILALIQGQSDKTIPGRD